MFGRLTEKVQTGKWREQLTIMKNKSEFSQETGGKNPKAFTAWRRKINF